MVFLMILHDLIWLLMEHYSLCSLVIILLCIFMMNPTSNIIILQDHAWLLITTSLTSIASNICGCTTVTVQYWHVEQAIPGKEVSDPCKRQLESYHTDSLFVMSRPFLSHIHYGQHDITSDSIVLFFPAEINNNTWLNSILRITHHTQKHH